MRGGVLGAPGFNLAVLGLVRGAPISRALPALLAGLMFGVRTALYVIGQILERLLKDAPDDG